MRSTLPTFSHSSHLSCQLFSSRLRFSHLSQLFSALNFPDYNSSRLFSTPSICFELLSALLSTPVCFSQVPFHLFISLFTPSPQLFSLIASTLATFPQLCISSLLTFHPNSSYLFSTQLTLTQCDVQLVLFHTLSVFLRQDTKEPRAQPQRQGAQLPLCDLQTPSCKAPKNYECGCSTRKPCCSHSPVICRHWLAKPRACKARFNNNNNNNNKP